MAIVGVVAVLTLPALMTNVSERVNSHREANIAYKITQATDKMKAMGLLNGNYKTTDEFVDELQKHLKISKRCDSNHIADCWPTNKVTTGDGEEFDVSKAKTGKNLNIQGNTSNNVGLVLADGASIILTYNQDSQGMDEGDPIVGSSKTLPVGFGKSEKFAYTSNTTSAIDFVMDVNGGKGPNSETRDNKMNDIRSFRVARFSKGCAGFKVNDACVVNLGTSYDCISTLLIPNNCWLGAVKACDKIDMILLEKSSFEYLAANKSSYPDLPQSGSFWSSDEEDFGSAWIFTFTKTALSPNGSLSSTRKTNKYGAMCYGDYE